MREPIYRRRGRGVLYSFRVGRSVGRQLSGVFNQPRACMQARRQDNQPGEH